MPSRYLCERYISNDYLKVSRVVRANSQWELDEKVEHQLAQWQKREAAERARQRAAQLKQTATNKSHEAQLSVKEYRTLLTSAFSVDHRVDWRRLYGKAPFHFDESPPRYEELAVELSIPRQSFWEVLSPKRRETRLEMENQARRTLQQRLLEHESRKEEALRRHLLDSILGLILVAEFRIPFEHREPHYVERYFATVLDQSLYPSTYDRVYDLQYSPVNTMLVIDCLLPSPEAVPRIIEYRYSAKDSDIRPIVMRTKEFVAYYESVLYQIVLRTIHEVFQSDYISSVLSVVLNGWVEGTDAATGARFTACLVSCQASREDFEGLALDRVDPKQCFRGLKGISAGPLINLTPVRPVLTINREDRRFVEAKDVLSGVESIPNLATMDWEDFEHLVRALFEKVFKKVGGEVKVTRASRDWGVDAIAFDPDPIRGGKFIIQAKRYNDLVGVSAVRDLYGAMTHERATRGILVTTSYYGPETYEFAKDKPITLIDGSNLLHMFKEHGYNVRIELQKKDG